MDVPTANLGRHPPLRAGQRADASVRLRRPRLDLAVHAQYEAAVSNAATGIAFVIGTLGQKPIIQEAAEQPGHSFVVTEEIRAFFRLFTLVWAAYFFLKAALFVWMAWTMPMLEAMALRSVIGGISLVLMIATSVTQGRRLFFPCRRLGLLPKPEPPPGAPAPSPGANS